MSVIWRVAAVSIIVWGMALVALVGYWQLAPYDVLTQFDGMRRQVTTLRPGEMVVFRSPVCKALDVPGTVSRSFVDGVVYQTPAVTTTMGVGCREGYVDVPVLVPNIAPGVYHLDTELRYRVNPLRDRVYRYTTEDFTVLPKASTGTDK